MKRLAATLALVGLALSTPVEAKSPHKEFMGAWAQRDLEYQQEFTDELKRSNEATETFLKHARSTTSGKEELAGSYEDMLLAQFEASGSKSKGLLLQELIALIEEKPSAALGEMWMQRQVAKVREQEAEVRQLVAKLDSIPQGSDNTWAIIGAMENWVQAQGALEGTVDELVLIDQNLQSYFQAQSKRAENRRSGFRAFLVGMAASLAQQRQQVTRENNVRLPLTTRCNTYFSGTVCQTQ